MSARILSMVPTLRLTQSGREIADRRFLADLMYIGGSTRCFREAMTGCQPLGAQWVMVWSGPESAGTLVTGGQAGVGTEL